jgi:hypothetical protein
LLPSSRRFRRDTKKAPALVLGPNKLADWQVEADERL